MKPVCIPCQRFYRCKKTGYFFIEGMPTNNNAPPGITHAKLWKPYKLWSGDLYECPGCAHKTIAGVAHAPIAEQHQPDFTMKVELHRATFQVNDC